MKKPKRKSTAKKAVRKAGAKTLLGKGMAGKSLSALKKRRAKQKAYLDKL